jgi:adenylate cyclase
VESAPAGGTTTQAGVLFVDVRGFTSLAETVPPDELSRLLRGFYAHAEHVLLPHALIDKLIGDQVMAIYAPIYVDPGQVASPGRMAALMLDHAQLLLQPAVGLELGIGMDFGELFIGNIGDGAVHDFTAVGDVVNTASRLQSEAGPGEIVLSERLAALLPEPVGVTEEVSVKGKAAPVAVRRIARVTS